VKAGQSRYLTAVYDALDPIFGHRQFLASALHIIPGDPVVAEWQPVAIAEQSKVAFEKIGRSREAASFF
jgi:hypothetical protein